MKEYDDDCDCWGCARFLNDIWDRYQRPIWLTELACPNENGTLSRQVTFMRNALKVLDEDDAVERCSLYAFFSLTPANMFLIRF